MPSLLNGGYAPPGVYTQTFFGAPPVPPSVPPVLPLFIGTGLETLSQSNLPVVRGSSSTVDQQIVSEDEADRMVVSVNPDGSITLGAFDGTSNRFQVKNFPIVSGDGTGTAATDTSAVSVTVNGDAIVVLGLDSATGLVEISEYPLATDVVLCTYFFDRTDTQVTDDVSSQVTTTAAILDGQTGENFAFVLSTTDTFKVAVDGLAQVSITMPTSAVSFTAAVVVATINGASGIGSLVATAYTNYLGRVCIRLTADVSIVLGDGNANGVLGFVANQSTARNRTFYVFNGPIVTGDGGGVTSTNPADLVVEVDGVEVTATSVDGRTRAVTLPAAPVVGSTVTIQYYFNTWQDTFDYLANTGISAITRAAITPNSNGAGVFIQGSDYILKNDTILWGTASLVSSGLHTEGFTAFGSTQVTASLVDNRAYLSPCSTVLVTSGNVSVESRTQFQLAFQPTTGNGRSNPLGSSMYLTVANDRMDLPTDQPELVTAYWGFGVLDALNRGAVTVLKVDSETSTITLGSEVPEGATVYATFYYNTLVDQAFVGSSRGYTLTCVTPGTSGVGTYSLVDGLSRSKYGVTLTSKGTDLATVTVNFPSGSELFPDARIEGGTPIDETVVVRFETSDTTPARFTFPASGPYFTVPGQSSNLRVTIDGVAGSTGGVGGIDLTLPSGVGRAGAFASLLGGEVAYTAASGETTYTVVAGVDDVVSVLVDGVSLTATSAAGAVTVAAYATAINAAAIAGGAADPYYTAAGSFAQGYTVTINEYDRLMFNYTGATSGTSGSQTVTLTPATYTAATLAAEISAQIAIAVGLLAAPFLGLAIVCTATADSKMRFTLTQAAGDASGVLEFIVGGTPARDFAIIAGIDTAAAAAGAQTKLYSGPIATRHTVATTGGRLPYDRLILRNRIMPGAGSLAPFHALSITGLASQGGTGAVKAGLPAGATGEAAYRGTALGPTFLGVPGWVDGIGTGFADARDGMPVVRFYDGSDPSFPANNVFNITVNGVLVAVTFTGSGAGTLTALGPKTTAGSILNTIQAAFSAVPGTITPVAIQEGAGIRIYGAGTDSFSQTATFIIGSGSANATLGFTTGAVATATGVTAKQVASTLMSHVQTYASWVLDPSAVGAGYFASKAIAGVEVGLTNKEYVYIQSRTLGTASSFAFANATTLDALRTGTGLGLVSGDGANGEAAINGFFVKSSDPTNGSGSANTSVLNTATAGTGQDGSVGQTYVDDVTGLTFTILPRDGGLDYPTGSNATLTFRSSTTILTDSNIPVLAIPGLELTVSNTVDVPAGDTALVETFKRGGSEPSIGEAYYVSYNYTKTDFTPKLFAKLSDVVNEYGPVSPDNPLSLAAHLAFLNGSTVIGTMQVQKTTGSSQASEAAYLTAMDDSAGDCLPGSLSPTVLVFLTPATANLVKNVSIHCDVQSSIRFKAERTAIFGFAAGTRADQVGLIAQTAGSTRVRFVYPEIATVSLTDVFGKVKSYLVDGRYPAAALAAATTSPTIDPATPWESRQLVGFTLSRRLSTTTANQIAIKGITVLENKPPFVKVRHGLTSDMSNILTKTPTVIQITDEMQRRVRAVLDPFKGQKFLPQVLGQIEGQLSEMYKRAVAEQIIAAFKGISVIPDPEDPTGVLADSYFAPVFPLLYIQVTQRVTST